MPLSRHPTTLWPSDLGQILELNHRFSLTHCYIIESSNILAIVLLITFPEHKVVSCPICEKCRMLHQELLLDHKSFRVVCSKTPRPVIVAVLSW